MHEAAREVRHKARDLASHLLEADPQDIVFVAGTVGVAGVPDRSLSWASLVAAANDRNKLPEGMEPGLAAEADFAGEGSYPFGAHCAVVEVDLETGDARLVRFFAVDDCGVIINPLLAEGQVHGGIRKASDRRCSRRSCSTIAELRAQGRWSTTWYPASARSRRS